MNKGNLLSIVALASLIAPLLAAQKPAYLDPSVPLEKRVDDLIQRLNIDEKASLLSTNAPAIPRLKIPEMDGSNQSLHGIVWTKPTTMFPVPINMAATWNPHLVHDVAAAIADEGRAVYNYWPTVPGKIEPMTPLYPEFGRVTVTANGDRLGHNGLEYRSPVVNMDRDPRWGRIWESFGEDPFLASRMTVAYVKGTQGDDPKYLKLVSTIKHFAVNDQERDRNKISVDVSERMMREYFFPQFQAGVMAGHAQSIMSSYNEINGMPNSENRWLLTNVLRDEWGFDGFVVPDTLGMELLVNSYKKYKTYEEAAAKTVLAGSDVDTGGYARLLPKALADGYLTENDINQALRHVLKVRFRLGEFDPPEMVPYSKYGPEMIDSKQHRELALQAAQQSIVLLANKNNLLPLDKSNIKSIAVIGPFANLAQTGAGYTGLYSKFVKPLEGIRNKVPSSTKVLYARGSGILEPVDPDNQAYADTWNLDPSYSGASFAEAVSIAKQADVAIVFVGINELLEREDQDRTYLNLPPVQLKLIRQVLAVNPKTVVVLLNGGPVSLKTWQVSVDAPTVLDMFWAGEEGGNAIADVIFGNYNPGGKLPYTVYDSLQGLPPMTEYDITKGFTYMYFEGKPSYAFGHGLSYTQFDYGNLKLSSSQVVSTGQVTIQVDVRNSGKRVGDEVVQLYVHKSESKVKRPIEQLAGFERITLQPGEKKTVSFSLPVKQLSFWDSDRKSFAVEPGTAEFMVGSASDDIRLRGEFQVTTAGQWPPGELTVIASTNK